MDMFFQDDDDDAFTVEEERVVEQIESEKKSYEDIVKDLILDETQYLRELNMIIKIFREPFIKLFPNSKVCSILYCTVHVVHRFTMLLLLL